jgi:hypothetical protein
MSTPRVRTSSSRAFKTACLADMPHPLPPSSSSPGRLRLPQLHDARPGRASGEQPRHGRRRRPRRQEGKARLGPGTETGGDDRIGWGDSRHLVCRPDSHASLPADGRTEAEVETALARLVPKQRPGDAPSFQPACGDLRRTYTAFACNIREEWGAAGFPWRPTHDQPLPFRPASLCARAALVASWLRRPRALRPH